MLTSGQLLAERYRLTRRIAVGGMGEVWEAADTRLDRQVAVKVLKPELCGDAEFLHRFRTEARTTASLNHPGIAAVHDYGETAAVPDGPQDTAYLVMELVEGEPLAAILARVGRLPADQTLDILEQAGTALQAAHERGYVHRDVKPGNIMIATDAAGKSVVKLTDFGIAKAADAAPVTRSGMVMGTAHYIAPEQALGHDAEPASDVYSLAVVGYECLMGHRPFLSENAVTVAMMHIRDVPPPLPPDVPPGVRALIEATLVKDPRQRYRSGGEFAAAVAAVRAGAPLPTPSGLVVAQHLPVGQPPPPPPMQVPVPNRAVSTMSPSAPVPPPRGPMTGTFTGIPAPRRDRRGHWLIAVIVFLAIVLLGLGTWVLVEAIHRGGGTPDSTGSTGSTGNTGGGATPGSSGGRQGSASTAPGAGRQDGQESGAGVELHQNEYLHQPATDVEADLRSMGLKVRLQTPLPLGPQPSDPDHCAVTAVTPRAVTSDGTVPPGTLVLVTCDPGGNTR